MKIRRSRKGACDKRMRRSTRNTSALILDLVTLTPAAVSLPAYYASLRTLTRQLQLASDRFVSRFALRSGWTIVTRIC
ncbi:hypothetical protein WH47_11975 [Habropoda laboriosa]|uniref:Uncharacterized protein n=1 Tax=Habropoda laboriosa TaxID=597456 RepID=A0A0L7R831_9HYME|nr:hypothetical protein WH47_11975 [Habropoda laboriosa]